MLTLSCPSCGASVGFRSKASVFAVCSYCNSTLVRQDAHLSLLGKMGELQDEMTPVQIGTGGEYAGQKFEIIGRMKIAYSEGVWNEWYCIFSDGRTGWLAEAQGFWAMCFPLAETDLGSVPARSGISPGARVLFRGELFEVEDMRQVVCKYSEGELPLQAAQGRSSWSVDLTGPDEEMATIEYSSEAVRAYCGGYEEFDAFKFTNLREIDGW